MTEAVMPYSSEDGDDKYYRSKASEEALKKLATEMHTDTDDLVNQGLFEYNGKSYGQVFECDETGSATFNIVDGKVFHLPDYIRKYVYDDSMDIEYVGKGRVKVSAIVSRQPTEEEAYIKYPNTASRETRAEKALYIKTGAVNGKISFDCDIDELEEKLSDPASFSIKPRDGKIEKLPDQA